MEGLKYGKLRVSPPKEDRVQVFTRKQPNLGARIETLGDIGVNSHHRGFQVVPRDEVDEEMREGE